MDSELKSKISLFSGENLAGFFFFIVLLYAPALHFLYPELRHGGYFGPMAFIPLIGTFIRMVIGYFVVTAIAFDLLHWLSNRKDGQTHSKIFQVKKALQFLAFLIFLFALYVALTWAIKGVKPQATISEWLCSGLHDHDACKRNCREAWPQLSDCGGMFNVR